jgi:hypothetical protein
MVSWQDTNVHQASVCHSVSDHRVGGFAHPRVDRDEGRPLAGGYAHQKSYHLLHDDIPLLEPDGKKVYIIKGKKSLAATVVTGEPYDLFLL